MLTVKKDDFDENTDDILKSINDMLNQKQQTGKDKEKEEKKEKE